MTVRALLGRAPVDLIPPGALLRAPDVDVVRVRTEAGTVPAAAHRPAHGGYPGQAQPATACATERDCEWMPWCKGGCRKVRGFR